MQLASIAIIIILMISRSYIVLFDKFGVGGVRFPANSISPDDPIMKS